MINKRILLIYTGGTIGMVKDKEKNTLIPFNFDGLLKAIPELKNTSYLSLFTCVIHLLRP